MNLAEKNFKQSPMRFVMRVTVIHVITYILCGIIFSYLFDYQTLFQLEKVQAYMRSYDGVSTLIGPIVQVIRGLLFGVILLLLRNVFVGKKYGWLRLWAIIVVIGIINIPGAAPGSIEGIIYTQIPLQFHLMMSPEVWIQTLLFSYFVAKPKNEKKPNRMIAANKTSFMTVVFAGIMFSLSGIVLALIIKADILAGTTDLGAFIVMFVALAIVFFTTKWYISTPSAKNMIIISIIYYIALAVLPTVYNYLANSAFKSPVSLIINIIPIIVLVSYLHFTGKNK